MARTAPVPNIPPIPGMCPSVAVMGGGGGAGGGSGGSGSSGDGSAGAGPEDGGEDTGTDGRSAASCGQGAPGNCPNCSDQISRGDPVDVATGTVFTVPAVDVFLPGPMPFELRRGYLSSIRRQDAGLGYGWAHSLGWRIEVRRTELRVLTDDGAVVHFPPPPPKGFSESRGGWRVHRFDWGFVVDKKDYVARIFSMSPDDGRTYVLTGLEDANKNRIELTYDGTRLKEIKDSAGRVIHCETDESGRIRSLSTQNAPSQGRRITLVRYDYDEEGNLTGVTRPTGARHSYRYERDHLLADQRDAFGCRFHYRYDKKHRCIETWGDYDEGIDLGLDESVSDRLADDRTTARGFMHCRFDYDDVDNYVEVVDSVQVQRFFYNEFGKLDKATRGAAVVTRTFDKAGNVLTRTDAMEATTQYTYARRGFLISVTDPIGRTIRLHRDGTGRIMRTADAAGNERSFERDSRGNLVASNDELGQRWGYEYDTRGLRVADHDPSGGTIRRTFDAHGNLTQLTQANGGQWHYEYDFLGNCLKETDPLGHTRLFTYTDDFKPASVRYGHGGSAYIRYDAAGHISEHVDADGLTTRYRWTHFNRCIAIELPDGTAIRRRYDREGRLVRVINGDDESHTRTFDVHDRVIAETSFDGRTTEYQYDAVSRLVRTKAPDGKVTTQEYNPAGDLVARQFDDGTAEAFHYNARGDLTGIDDGQVALWVDRDASGRVIGERQVVSGVEHAVRTTFGALGSRQRRETSLGHAVEHVLDALGEPTQTILDKQTTIKHELDLTGREMHRGLPGGGGIHHHFDQGGRLRRRWSTEAGAPEPEPGEPEWIGGQPGVTNDRLYDYSLASRLTSRTDAGGSTRYEYDGANRLLSVDAPNGTRRGFSHSRGGALFEQGGPTRKYDPGGRLIEHGAHRLVYDDAGQLIERRDTASGEVTKYAWDARGRLSSVERPDGVTLAYWYDATGRRLRAETRERVADGTVQTTKASRYVWDANTIVHEIVERAADNGDPVEEVRTYCAFDEGAPVPWAEKVDGSWRYYVNDLTGAPEAIVDDAGQVIDTVDRDVYGASSSTATAFRFAGQSFDESTGLVYNRHRYYDAELGLYISPDPLGLLGGLYPYRYCPNPLFFVDPLGLHDMVAQIVHADGRVEPLGNFPSRNSGGSRSRDSEREMINSLSGRTDLAGSTIQMFGDCHSCASCVAALDEFRQRPENEGMTVQYTSVGNQGSLVTLEMGPNPPSQGTLGRADYEAERGSRQAAGKRQAAGRRRRGY